jgi:DNA-binding MarR family transcriptional regulator
MQVFVDRAEFEAIVARLAEQGWIEQSQAEDQSELPFQLTAEGRQRHSQILAAQQAARRQAMLGISDEEYAAAVRVLQQIVRNLSESGVDLSPSDQ